MRMATCRTQQGSHGVQPPTSGLDSLDKYVKAWHCFWRAQQRLIRGVDRIGLIWAAGGCCVVSCYECGMSRSPSPSSWRHSIIFMWAERNTPLLCVSFASIKGGGKLWTAILCKYRMYRSLQDTGGTHLQVRACTALYSFFVRRSYIP